MEYNAVKYDMLQPWSNFIMKTKLPNNVLNKMIEITDRAIENKNTKHWGKSLAGQIDKELLVDMSELKRAGIHDYFMDVLKEYIVAALQQKDPRYAKNYENANWVTEMLAMWIVSQRDNEYNPCHQHTKCSLSSVMYLKIPEFLPSRKEGREDDGNIVFVNSTCNDSQLVSPQFSWRPQVGDFFVFPAQQSHFVYPFRTADGKGERRSVSFNAIFATEDEIKAQQEQQKQLLEANQTKQMKEGQRTYQGEIPTLTIEKS